MLDNTCKKYLVKDLKKVGNETLRYLRDENSSIISYGLIVITGFIMLDRETEAQRVQVTFANRSGKF